MAVWDWSRRAIGNHERVKRPRGLVHGPPEDEVCSEAHCRESACSCTNQLPRLYEWCQPEGLQEVIPPLFCFELLLAVKRCMLVNPWDVDPDSLTATQYFFWRWPFSIPIRGGLKIPWRIIGMDQAKTHFNASYMPSLGVYYQSTGCAPLKLVFTGNERDWTCWFNMVVTLGQGMNWKSI